MRIVDHARQDRLATRGASISILPILVLQGIQGKVLSSHDVAIAERATKSKSKTVRNRPSGHRTAEGPLRVSWNE